MPPLWRRALWLRPMDAAQIVTVGVLMGLVELGLRTVRVDKVSRWLGVAFLDEHDAHPEAAVVRLERRERRWIDNANRVLRRWPLDRTCLRRSLLLGWILRRRGPRLIIGVRTEDGTVHAHAWIRLNGLDLDAAAEQFLVFKPQR